MKCIINGKIIMKDGLLEGMRLSSKGGDYKAAFKRGTDAAYRYDDANAAFNQVR